MKILLVHNYYQQPGGEDQVFLAEKNLLVNAKHEVHVYERHNQEIRNYKIQKRISLIGNTIWSKDSQKDIEQLLDSHHPDIVHFHNTFPLISPSAYYSCQRYGAGVVQTLHNFRYLCPNGLFFRDSHPCEDCLGRTVPWPGVLHACYRNSRDQTAVTGAMLTTHRLLGSLQKKVDKFIALSNFSKEKFIQGGLPSSKITVKPNFISPDPGVKEGRGQFLLFVGRLSLEKGIKTLLHAAQKNPDIPIKIVGDGPILQLARDFAAHQRIRHIQFLGRLSREETLCQMKQARALVFPSECYENCPTVILEAYACGLPVIASRLGGTRELVKDGITGLLFTPSNPNELSEKMASLWSDQIEAEKMSQAARKEFENRFSAERNLQQIIQIYQSVLEGRSSWRWN